MRRVVYITQNNTSLYHYGIKGMKWGIRRSAEYLAKSRERVKMNLQFFAKRAKSRPTLNLDVVEYAHVMSELRTNITKEQKTHTVINKAIGNHIYTFENHFDDTYRIIGKKMIPDSVTQLFERNKYEK